MTSALRIAIVVVLATTVGIAIGIGALTWYQQRGGEPRPAFTLPDPQGERHAIDQWDGQVVVLNFWATWCLPCREEIPLFIELQKRFGDQGVQFVGVAVDRVEAVRAFVEQVGMNYPTLHGIAAAMDVGALYGNESGTLPYTVVIDKSGAIRHVFRKQVDRADIEPVLRELSEVRPG